MKLCYLAQANPQIKQWGILNTKKPFSLCAKTEHSPNRAESHDDVKMTKRW